jgi:hypothetical protein
MMIWTMITQLEVGQHAMLERWAWPEGLFSWQIFWRNATVAVSLLFGKYCPIMV